MNKMNCPNCKQPIDDKLINRHFASKGGKASRRSIDEGQQAMMQDARTVKKVVDKLADTEGAEYLAGPRGSLVIKSTPEVSEIIFPIADMIESYREADGSIWYRLKRSDKKS